MGVTASPYATFLNGAQSEHAAILTLNQTDVYYSADPLWPSRSLVWNKQREDGGFLKFTLTSAEANQQKLIATAKRIMAKAF